MNKEIKITYFFQGGRLSRLESKEPYAKEMFYGFNYLNKKYPNTKIVEFSEHKTKIRRLFFLLVEKQLRRILKLPLYWSFLLTKENYERIYKSDYLVFSNNRMACSVLPFLLLPKIKRKKIGSLCFVMGLFSRTPKFKILSYFQNIYISKLIHNIDNFIFLSFGEYSTAVNNFPKESNKFIYKPFAVDQNMWKKGETKKEKTILFVGNDGFRDYNLAEKIANTMPEYKFKFISEQINEKNLNGNNHEVVKGSWGEPAISDKDLRDEYRKAFLTIVPLQESLQPSGQSVTLQSISCGTPVIISSTKGFWDIDSFIDGENIFFAKENGLQYWTDKIKDILNLSKNEYELISKRGIETIKNNYDLYKFSEEIENILIKEDSL